MPGTFLESRLVMRWRAHHPLRLSQAEATPVIQMTLPVVNRAVGKKINLMEEHHGTTDEAKDSASVS